MADRNIMVEQLTTPAISQRAVELVERKGVGHPDSLIDAIVERVSRDLCVEYLDKFGKILHHNVDKGLIIGGAAEADFGGGRMTRPIEVILTGRATSDVDGKKIPVDTIALHAARNYFKENTRFLNLDDDLEIESKISSGSKDLVELFLRGPAIPMANDTSFGIGFAPYTELEQVVLETERLLNSKEYKAQVPSVGEDVKVMGLRDNGELHVTVAIAFVARHVAHLDEYVKLKEQITRDILANAKKFTSKPIYIYLNTGDDIDHASVYLTVTGLSCEMGDDGSVGRGNRVNGLITPMRPMSLEAAAGKNPVNHIGKIYNILATQVAQDVVKQYPSIAECNVTLLSQIGQPIDKPKSAGVQLVMNNGEKLEAVQGKVRDLVDGWLQNINSVQDLIIKEKVKVW